MKRLRLGYGGGGDQNVDSASMAGVLMLLSRSSGSNEAAETAAAKVFECKTCSRRFASFQALGGHRASHKKPRPHVADGSGGGGGGGGRNEKTRVHECSVCGLEFSIGQALGGHMRRHRAEAGVLNSIGGGGGKKRVWLDLNLPPTPMTEEDESTDCRKMGFGLDMADQIPCPLLINQV